MEREKPAPQDVDSDGRPVKEKTPGSHPLPQLINPKGKPAPA
jgi:hypothetical protein